MAVDARTFDYDPRHRLDPGNLLFRPAVGIAALRVEEFLYRPGVSTFYTEPDGIHFRPVTATMVFEAAGLPVPPTVYAGSGSRELLRSFADRVGGFPLVVKSFGLSGGVGVVRVDSFSSLFSVVDYVLARGAMPALMPFLDAATHWRVVLVGDQAVATYRNPVAADDFRSHGSDDPADYHAVGPEPLARLAHSAMRALRREFGGVDILESSSGELFLLEANFPCYFVPAQTVGGLDVAGAMVDHLIGKAQRLAT